jgi:hypothetical protein
MTVEEHNALHHIFVNNLKDPAIKAKHLQKCIEYAATDECKEKQSLATKKKGQNKEYRETMLGVLKKAGTNPSLTTREKISDGHKNHKSDCRCFACRSHRGDQPKHKENCPCAVCNAKTSFKNHKDECGCGCCMARRGERPQHKIDCTCSVCKSTRKESHREDCTCGVCKVIRNKKCVIVNHKVVSVEWLDIKEDTYDLSIEKNHNFPTAAGVFVSNSDPMYAEFRTMHMMTGVDSRQISSRYGTSLLVDALPTYKRLRLAEDSLLMARLTRGILRYVWKLRVTSQNAEATEALMSQLTGVLKKARALDISAGTPNFDSKFSVLANNEDLIIPVWGDSANDLTSEKIGGDVDIRWIVDVEELRQQLACTLRVPLSLLGGYVKEASGSLGSDAIEKLDIGFARSARRLQRALKQTIKRICQIHLAYMNMDPDPALFDICMNESSTAEEESARDSLDKGLDAVNKMLETIESADPEKTIDRKKVVDYLNKKILKLGDFSLDNFLLETSTKLPTSESINETKLTEDESEIQAVRDRAITNNDLSAYLPINESSNTGKFFDERHQENWETRFKNVKVGSEESFKSIKEPVLRFKD